MGSAVEMLGTRHRISRAAGSAVKMLGTINITGGAARSGVKMLAKDTEQAKLQDQLSKCQNKLQNRSGCGISC